MNSAFTRLVVASALALIVPVRASPAAPAADGGRNLVSNPSMADGADAPAGWTVSDYRAGTVRVSRDAEQFKSDPAALRFETVGGPGAGFAHQRLADAAVGQGVIVTCSAKVDGRFDTVQLALQVFDGQWKQIGWVAVADLSSASDWKHFTGKAEVPDGAANVLLGVSIKGDGRVWLDDVTATVTSSSPDKAPTTAPAVAALPVRVAMTDPAVRLVGRFDTSDPAAPRCAWSASAVALRFHGTAVNARLSTDNWNDRWQVVVDGRPSAFVKLGPPNTEHTVPLAIGLPDGEHTVEMVKAGEPIFGTTRLLGFDLSEGGRALPSTRPQRKIEVIGDSISCGYGNLAKSEKEKFSPDTENAYQTYGAIAARQLGAEYVCVAWSGRKMSPDNTIAEVYGRTLPWDPGSRWAFADRAPDAVVICLGTNDFWGKNPDEARWTGDYAAFIGRLRTHNPDALIYCATSPMMSDQWAQEQKPAGTLLRYLNKVIALRAEAGDRNVKLLEFAPQDGANGIGADWHPSVRTHEIMADVLAGALKRDLGWLPEPTASPSR